MATIKHLSSKNSNYAAAESYLTFQHNEYTGLPILDEKGRPKLRAELDWLLWNKPLEHAQMVLRGEMEHYLSLGCDHSRLED